MRIGFVTCVQLGLSCMEAIYQAGGHLELAVTLPKDKARAKSGRVYIDDFCARHRIPLVKSPHVGDDGVVQAIRSSGLDWLFIVGWSQIAPQRVLEAPKRGVLGMHPTLLPEGRGRASIPWAILKGLPCTGVTLFKLDEGVDTGPILAQESVAISDRETARTLYDKINVAHQDLIRRVWDDLVTDRIRLQPQDDSQATTWSARRPQDGRIDPQSMTVAEIDQLVRAVTDPYPGAFLDTADARVRIWSGSPLPSAARCGSYSIEARDGTYYAVNYAFENVATSEE